MQTITYNLLTPNYCSPEHFVQADPKALQPKYRFKLICQKLLQYMTSKSVLLLQEVSADWCCQLQVFFRNKGYIFITAQYDRKWSDYMGVGIAFPQEATLKSMQRVVIGSKIRMQAPEETWPQWAYYSIRHKFGYPDERPRDTQAIIQKAKQRLNVALAIKLEQDGVECWYCTYHFPCAFKIPLIMNLHGEACLKWLQKLEKEAPVVFGSDMNSQPDSPVYSLFDQHFNSAYKEKYGTEPESTNKVFTRWNNGFTGTLDYIWCSKMLTVVDMLEIPTLKKELPNLTEPSDHVLLAATLAVDKKNSD